MTAVASCGVLQTAKPRKSITYFDICTGCLVCFCLVTLLIYYFWHLTMHLTWSMFWKYTCLKFPQDTVRICGLTPPFKYVPYHMTALPFLPSKSPCPCLYYDSVDSNPVCCVMFSVANTTSSRAFQTIVYSREVAYVRPTTVDILTWPQSNYGREWMGYCELSLLVDERCQSEAVASCCVVDSMLHHNQEGGSAVHSTEVPNLPCRQSMIYKGS